ncbi:hypothetical protein P7A74_03400 [Clostridium perfringens]|nr:hypothetical protein [Clostridium perfringens]
MSVTNFKTTLWEGGLLANFHSVSIAHLMSTAPTEINGEKVIFNRVANGNLKDYTGTIAWDDVNTTPIEMVFDQKKYFAFSLDDVDKAQLKADVMKPTLEEHGAILAETYDKNFFTVLAAGAKSENNIGSKSKKKTVTPKEAYDYIVDLGTKLSKKKVPKADRFVTVDSEYLGLLSKDDRFTKNPNVLANGIVEGQKINGLQVMSSEELPDNTIIAHHKSAIGSAKQLQKTEAMRLQGSFADGIRGLCVYGSKVLREEAISVLYYELKVAEETV